MTEEEKLAEAKRLEKLEKKRASNRKYMARKRDEARKAWAEIEAQKTKVAGQQLSRFFACEVDGRGKYHQKNIGSVSPDNYRVKSVKKGIPNGQLELYVADVFSVGLTSATFPFLFFLFLEKKRKRKTEKKEPKKRIK